MTIETRTEVYYYCTVCDKEYAQEDKEDGLVCLSCHSISHDHDISLEQGCQSCMRRCGSSLKSTRSRLGGCGQWFCKSCTSSTIFEAWYPTVLCKECVSKYGLEKFYGDDKGEALMDEIKQWRIATFGKFPTKIVPGTDGRKTKNIRKEEIDQKIFQRFYVSVKHNRKKDGWIE